MSKLPCDILFINASLRSPGITDTLTDAIVVHNGRIAETGRSTILLNRYEPAKIVDVQDRFMYPGFIDSHGHFYYHGLQLQQADLRSCKSMAEIVDKLKSTQKTSNWILGFGWDDTKWTSGDVPENTLLNSAFPDTPVLLTRIDLHAALVNDTAVKIAGLSEHSSIAGGEVVTDHTGRITGLLIDAAVTKVASHVPEPQHHEKIQALQAAEMDCFKNGITSVGDMGLPEDLFKFCQHALQEKLLDINLYMLGLCKPEDEAEQTGESAMDDVRSVKYFADGALGSRGAYLTEPYSDAKDRYGFLIWEQKALTKAFKMQSQRKRQVCVHAIGDGAVEKVLEAMQASGADTKALRWRLEHAQVVNPRAIQLFKKLKVIPSMQPVQAASDAPWIEKRLGNDRLQWCFRFKSLLKAVGRIALNSDFPIEKPNVFRGFATVISGINERGIKVCPEGETLNREEALNGYTLWNAYAQFDEKNRGSLETGKLADFVISDTDLMNAPPEAIRAGKVLETWKAGKCVFTA